MGLVRIRREASGGTIQHSHTAVVCANQEHASRGVQTYGLNIGLAGAGGIIWSGAVGGEHAAGPIETAQSPGTTDPQRAGFVFNKGPCLIAGQTGCTSGFMAIVNKGICVLIVAVDSLIRPHPQNARSINIERPNTVAAKTAVILIVVLVDLECIAVVAIQAAEPRAKPHESMTVLGNCPHVGV